MKSVDSIDEVVIVSSRLGSFVFGIYYNWNQICFRMQEPAKHAWLFVIFKKKTMHS